MRSLWTPLTFLAISTVIPNILALPVLADRELRFNDVGGGFISPSIGHSVAMANENYLTPTWDNAATFVAVPAPGKTLMAREALESNVNTPVLKRHGLVKRKKHKDSPPAPSKKETPKSNPSTTEKSKPKPSPDSHPGEPKKKHCGLGCKIKNGFKKLGHALKKGFQAIGKGLKTAAMAVGGAITGALGIPVTSVHNKTFQKAHRVGGYIGYGIQAVADVVTGGAAAALTVASAAARVAGKVASSAAKSVGKKLEKAKDVVGKVKDSKGAKALKASKKMHDGASTVSGQGQPGSN